MGHDVYDSGRPTGVSLCDSYAPPSIHESESLWLIASLQALSSPAQAPWA